MAQITLPLKIDITAVFIVDAQGVRHPCRQCEEGFTADIEEGGLLTDVQFIGTCGAASIWGSIVLSNAPEQPVDIAWVETPIGAPPAAVSILEIAQPKGEGGEC